FNQGRQPVFAAKVQLKSPMTQRHNPRRYWKFFLPGGNGGSGHIRFGRRRYLPEVRPQLRANTRIVGGDPAQNVHRNPPRKSKGAAIEVIADQALVLKTAKSNWIFNDAGHEVTIPLAGKIVPAV